MDRNNAQGLIISPYRYRRISHLFFTIPEDSDIPKFYSEALPHVVFGSPERDKLPSWFINIGLTSSGLSSSGCSDELRLALDPHFRDGPDPASMGDAADSDSRGSYWWDGQWNSPKVEIDLTVQVYAREAEESKKGIEWLELLAEDCGLRQEFPRRHPDHNGSRRLECMALPRATGDTRPGARVHFGYRDGLTKPDIDWDEPEAGEFDPANFVLGYSNPDAASSPASEPASSFFRDSSYMVLRWIQQDTYAFEKFLTDSAPTIAPDRPLEEGREYVAAKMMGRWRDGTPLVLSPEHPDPSLASHDFKFHASDPSGYSCPFSAHIRVVNPRDQPLDSNAPFPTPQVIRRGMPYGPEWPAGQVDDDGIDRGIVGLFLCSSISRQFYTLMNWISQTDFSPVFDAKRSHDQDSLFGNRKVLRASSKLNIPKEGENLLLSGLPDFVRTRGTAFFLVPSRKLLEELSK